MLDAARDAGIPESALQVWSRFDGIEVGHGESRILALAELEGATAEARDAGLLGEGEWVIGAFGLDDLALPEDPWEAGADVVLISDDGQRVPFGSTLARTVLALLARTTAVMDELGEYREEVVGEDGGLTPKAERKACRRHLDADEDAPFPRFRLAQLLRRDGQAAAARKELRLTLRRAPSFAWAELELGRASVDLGDWEAAIDAFQRAAALDEDPGWCGMVLAWAALAAGRAGDEEARAGHAQRSRASYPGLVVAYEAGAREAAELEDLARAGELVDLGLAVEPRHLGLLELRRVLAEPAQSG
jgi:tetratricopeptide (TPR) repeat protein